MATTLPSTPLRVLVADDHPVVRAGVVSIVSSDPQMRVVAEAATGVDAVAAWGEVQPDIALIDLRMPELDGFATLERIRQMDPRARLLVMSTLAGDEDVFRALHAGAGGFLLKDCGHAEMLEGLRTVARGSKYLQSAAAASLAERVTHDALTRREQEVLGWLAQGLSNKHIARRLDVAEGTVKTHVKSILSKLGAASRTQAVHAAASRGLLHPTAA